MKHFLLFYTTADDYPERREIWRPEHFEYAWAASDRGELIVGGALEPREKKCVILFAGETAEVAERFARGDPYVREGLVTDWRVAEFFSVAGELALTPLLKPSREVGSEAMLQRS